MPPARNPTLRSGAPNLARHRLLAGTFQSMHVCLLFPEPLKVSPVQPAERGLANGSQGCVLPGFHAFIDLPGRTSRPSRSPRKLSSHAGLVGSSTFALLQCHPSCAAIMRSELLENKGTNGQDRGELRFLPVQRHPSRTPYPAVRDVATRPDDNVRAHLAGKPQDER